MYASGRAKKEEVHTFITTADYVDVKSLTHHKRNGPKLRVVSMLMRKPQSM